MSFPIPGTPEWGEMNNERDALIRARARGELTEPERVRLEFLQVNSAAALDDWRDNPDNQLPPWAGRAATGAYLEVGAILPTRDGRKIGNAVVIAAWHGDGSKGRILTDAGSVLLLSLGELREFFHEPIFVRKGF